MGVSIAIYGILNILLSNAMMQYFDIKVLAPLSFNVFSIVNTVNAFIFFRAAESLYKMHVLGLVCGIVAITFGVTLLSWPRDRLMASHDEKRTLLEKKGR